ncbi:anhydro-N-acetylmuramic acid kinase [Mangrovicella endophytica]|uniref:anhydro-N-acetylmuramic acid kinase n=1 Tax=Mangrovicella endophytica TaxID=2066697 RepID=UPI002477EB70|nr:anhydro-N-acetylmuramic acid kinase [Mangrovicella endophytica]
MTEPRLRRAVGLMSGTSLDGIDVALLDTDGQSIVRRGPSRVYPYEAGFRQRLSAALETAKTIEERSGRPGDLAAIEQDLTDLHAGVVERFLAETGTSRESIDLVGFHGQTVLHRPDQALTVQLGDGARLAGAVGLPVVYDMRAGDMRAGGQGAPLVPAYHAALARSLPEPYRMTPVVFVNVGGISNITYVEPDADPVAFDSGPGNALIDQWMEREAGLPFDQDGETASKGQILDALAERYLGSPFLAKPAPKSLDRFDFSVPGPDEGSLEDVARTLCFVTAEAILKATEHLLKPPKLWIICGGGRRHPVIMADLASGAARAGASVIAAEAASLDGDAMEAEAWAYLAVRSQADLPLTFPTTTGCSTPANGGVLALPAT